MEPIISPWIFYFIDKLDVVSELPLLIFAFGILTNLILVMVTETSEEFKKWFFPKAWLALFFAISYACFYSSYKRNGIQNDYSKLCDT